MCLCKLKKTQALGTSGNVALEYSLSFHGFLSAC